MARTYYWRLTVLLTLASALLLATAGTVWAQAVTVRTTRHAEHGNILVDGRGMTVYRFARDEGSTSNCYDMCAMTWPFVAAPATLAPGTGGTLGVHARRDGTRQVLYNGVPVYNFARDTNPGDTNGQGVGGVWFVVEGVAAVAALPRTGGGPASFALHPAWLAALGGAAAVGAGIALRRKRRAA